MPDVYDDDMGDFRVDADEFLEELIYDPFDVHDQCKFCGGFIVNGICHCEDG